MFNMLEDWAEQAERLATSLNEANNALDAILIKLGPNEQFLKDKLERLRKANEEKAPA